MNKKKVIVVIPTQKTVFNKGEQISIDRAFEVLKNYPICFAIPEKNRAYYDEKGYTYKCFPDKYFKSIETYSELLLDRCFYEPYSEYEYMLIYQPDVFVFEDRLEYFCSLDYDYIGAPQTKEHWYGIECQVGNGGLSLRKISSCVRVLESKEEIFERSGMRAFLQGMEDAFFAYCASQKDLNFLVPDVDTALTFSVQVDINNCFKRIRNGELPFGCHGWNRPMNFVFWKPVIENIVGNMDDVAKEMPSYCYSIADYDKQKYKLYYAMDHLSSVELSKLLEQYFPTQYTYSIWGYGIDGKRCVKLLKYIGREISCIYDKRGHAENEFGIEVEIPDDVKIMEGKSIILVSTRRYEEEIIQYLENLGMKKGKDFFSYFQIEKQLVDNFEVEVKDGKHS